MKFRRISPFIIAAIPTLACSEILLRQDGIIIDHELSRQSNEVGGQGLPQPDPAGSDILLFENGDLMHGTFSGIDEGLLWERTDISRPIKFRIPGVRQLVLKGGLGVGLDDKTSFITLVSGDRIPGEIISLDDKTLSLKSPVAGNLTIPRTHLKSISPNPFDGELFYTGPFTSAGWMTLDYKKTEAQLEKEEEAKKKSEKAGDKKKQEEKKEVSSPWIHSGAAFYSLGTRPLIMPDAELPEVGRIRFKASWKGRLNITLVLHSDFVRVLRAEKEEKEEDEEAEANEVVPDPSEEEKKTEEPKEEEKEPAPLKEERLLDLRKGEGFQNVPWINPTNLTHADIYGTGYTMTIYSSYPSLSRNDFSDAGIARSQRLSTTRSSMSLSESGDAEIEIRYNREEALVMLFVNGDYAAQWNDLSGYVGKGKGFGIANNTSSSQIKISDIAITSWNGMTDSAKSMNHPDRDVVLLTNGIDRFSGELTSITNGIARLKTGYTDVQIPADDLSKVILKGASQTDLEDVETNGKYLWEKDPITILYKPFGRIQIAPTSATKTTLEGTSPFLGKISVDLKSANILRFVETSPDISSWFDDF